MSNSPRYIGTQKNLALYESRGKSVLVNTKTLTASVMTGVGPDKKAFRPVPKADPVWAEIASAAIVKESTPTDISLSQTFKRTFTVPKRVAECSSSAVKAAGSTTPVGAYVASLLSSGDQVSCKDVLWISRFFGSHDAENTDRATWMAWGGDEGKRWSEGLASRLDYDSVTADTGAYETPGVEDFVETDQYGRAFFVELTDPLGQYAQTLYKLTDAGTWLSWGNGDWFETGEPSHSTENFVEVDEDAALYVAGALFDAPDLPVDLRTPNPEAWDLGVAARDEIDWTLIDRAMISAGPVAPASPPVADYTPEERSQNAAGQLRDANGRFANVGDSGAIKSSGIAGTVTSADPVTKQIVVAGADGQTYAIPASDFEVGAAAHPKADPAEAKDALQLDGILAPTPEKEGPKATLPVAGEVFGPVQINEALDNYSKHATAKRQEIAQGFKQIIDPTASEPVLADASPASDTELPADAADDVPPPSADPTPDLTDVDPVYMAVVDPEDNRAVTDLIALVPATATSSEPKTFRRSGGKWVEDPKILLDLRSATPPPVVQLDADQFADVMGQVDMEGSNPPPEDVPSDGEQTVTAAGGADRNRGNAEELRKYWTVGAGGLKIRWNTGGDWTRCVRLLSKHLGSRAKGYCALRHKEMTGMWPGDRKNQEMTGPSLTASGDADYSTDHIKRLPAVLRASADAAAAQAAIMRVRGTGEFSPIPPTPDDISEGRSGRAFTIPLLIPEGLATGDGRIFAKGALGVRTLPLPLLWQIQTGEGHDGSVLVGKIERIERTPSGLGNAYGVFDTGPYGQEAQRLVESGMLRWISADLDKFEVDEGRSDPENGKMFISKGRAMGATLVPKPAFQECTIELVPLEEPTMPSAVDAEPSAIVASAAIAQSIPVEPPNVWFDRPLLNGPTPITITDQGQVFGHIATWDTDHISFSQQSVRAPRSNSGYAYFHTGVLRTNEGSDVKVGQLTLSGGHAPIHLSADAAARHYDETRSAIADVHAGEDSYGIYVAGALRPGTTPEQIRALRASAPSGDWRAINRRLELVAVCQVNVPGFPVPRSLAASGHMNALVAAGSSTLLEMKREETHEERVALVAAARTRLFKVLDVDGYLVDYKSFSAEKREELIKSGKALADGSFPIENASDLRRALHAYEKASEAKQASVRRHIVKNARDLSKEDLLPTDWKETSMSASALSHRDRYETILASARQEKINELRARVNPVLHKQELNATLEALRNRIQK